MRRQRGRGGDEEEQEAEEEGDVLGGLEEEGEEEREKRVAGWGLDLDGLCRQVGACLRAGAGSSFVCRVGRGGRRDKGGCYGCFV